MFMYIHVVYLFEVCSFLDFRNLLHLGISYNNCYVRTSKSFRLLTEDSETILPGMILSVRYASILKYKHFLVN